MSLIQSSPLTPSQILANRVQQIANGLYNSIVFEMKSLFNGIWNNPSLTPDLAWAALGTNAVQARHAWVGLVQFVNAIQAGSITDVEPGNWTLTENNDGSIIAVKNS